MRRRSQRDYESPDIKLNKDRTHALSDVEDKMLRIVEVVDSNDEMIEFIFDLLAECGVDEKKIHWALNEFLAYEEFEYGSGEEDF